MLCLNAGSISLFYLKNSIMVRKGVYVKSCEKQNYLFKWNNNFLMTKQIFSIKFNESYLHINYT